MLRYVLTFIRVATVSVPIVAETCARRGAGFSRFLQLVPGKGESQTTGKLCVLHFLYEGQINIASLCDGRTKRKWDATRNLASSNRIELSYEDSPEATICATVSRLMKSDLKCVRREVQTSSSNAVPPLLFDQTVSDALQKRGQTWNRLRQSSKGGQHQRFQALVRCP